MSLFDYENLTKGMIMLERIHNNIYYNNIVDFYKKLPILYNLKDWIVIQNLLN